MLQGDSKKRKNSLTQQNDHTSVNFLAIWLKFYLKVDETCIELFYFIFKSPFKNTYKNRKLALKFLSLCLLSI